MLTEKQRLALIDHELCHIVRDVDSDSGFSMRSHDIEEFAAVVERHGAWKADVHHFLAAAKNAQLDLFDPSHNGASPCWRSRRLICRTGPPTPSRRLLPN